MIKEVIAISLVATALLLSACGENSDGESALDTQQMLDNKDYAGVINKVKDGNTTSDNLALAAAYMGRAGFSPSSIIGIVGTSADSSDSSTFATFVEKVKDSSNSQSLQDMKKAVVYYKKVIPNGCDTNTSLSGAESDICLYVGLSQVSQTAVAMSYIADNVSVLGDDTSGSDPKLTASTCAMQYAFDGSTSNSDCTFSSESNLTFTQSGVTYGTINITVNHNQTFEYLLTPAGGGNNRSTALTNGFCSVDDFTTRVFNKNDTNYISTYHACPIDEDGKSSTTTEDTLVRALNEGTDSIGAAASDDTKDDVDQFRKDVLKANGRENDSNTTVTIEDINKYLESKNN